MKTTLFLVLFALQAAVAPLAFSAESATGDGGTDRCEQALHSPRYDEALKMVRTIVLSVGTDYQSYVLSIMQSYGLTEVERIEIIKTAAAIRGEFVSQNIQSYNISNQATLIEIAKIAAEQSGWGISYFIKNYGITDQAGLIEIAKIAAAQNGGGTSRYIQNYGITVQAALVEIAKIATAQDGEGTSMYIHNYGITDQAGLIEIAKIAAAQSGGGTSEYIQNYGITVQAALVEIAKIAAAHNGERTSELIQNYGITDQAALVEIAKIAAAQDGEGTSMHIHNYGITDQAGLIEIAKIAAAQDGRGTSLYIQNYGITDHAALIQIAKIAVAQNGEGTSLFIQNYGITDPAALIEIAKIATAQNGEGTSLFIQNYGIPLELLILAFSQSGLDNETINLFLKLEPINVFMETDAVKALAIQLLSNSMTNSNAIEQLLWPRVQRQDVILGLSRELARYMVTHPGASLPTDATSLWLQALGLPLNLKPNLESLSTNTLGEVMAVGLDLARMLRNPLAGNALPQQWVTEQRGQVLLELLTRVRDFVSLVRAEPENNIRARAQSALNVREQKAAITNIEQSIMESLSQLFATPELAQHFSFDDLKRLEGEWGDLGPVYTLLARFQGNEKWRKEIPVLGQVFQAVLAGKFNDYKFTGTFDGLSNTQSQAAAAARQNSGLSLEQQQAWQTTVSRLDLWEQSATTQNTEQPAARPTENPRQSLIDHIQSNMIPHIGDALQMLEAQTPHADVAVLQNIAQTILTARQAPKQTIEELIGEYSVETVVRAVIHALNQSITSSFDDSTTQNLQRLSRFMGQLLSHEGVATVASELRIQLKNDVATLANLTKPTPQTTSAVAPTHGLVFTTTVLDPKTLLTIGNLVNVSSCQSYTSGSHIETLLGYVVDANVVGLGSWVITSSDFNDEANYTTLRSRLQNQEAHSLNLNPASRALTITIGSDVYTTKPLGYAHLRHIIKRGELDALGSGRTALFIERSYRQPHDQADAAINNGVQQVVQHVAQSIGAITVRGAVSASGAPEPQTIYFPASRNVGGIYSDAAKGIQTGPYSITQ